MHLEKSDAMKWRVSYSSRLAGPFTWVADEYADTYKEVERAILGAYTEEETPVGFYKIRPEYGLEEYLIEKVEHEDFDD